MWWSVSMTDICLTFFLTKFKRLFQSASHSVMSNYCSVHGILQDRTLEWAAFLFSRGSSQPRDWTQVSHIAGRFFTSWFTREAQEYWSGWPIPSPADVPDPGVEPGSPALQVDSSPTELPGNYLCHSFYESCRGTSLLLSRMPALHSSWMHYHKDQLDWSSNSGSVFWVTVETHEQYLGGSIWAGN